MSTSSVDDISSSLSDIVSFLSASALFCSVSPALSGSKVIESTWPAQSQLTSVECERSFSVLRRLKTWLQRTTGQSRLNHELILVAHSARPVDLDGVIEDLRPAQG